MGKGLKVEGSAAEGDSARRNRLQFPSSSTLQICRVIKKDVKVWEQMAKGLGELGGRAHARVGEAETDVSVLKRSVAGLRSLCVTRTGSKNSSSDHRKVSKMWKQPPLGSHLERTPCYSTGDASREWKQALVTFKELSEGAVHHDWADGSRRQPVTVCSQGSKEMNAGTQLTFSFLFSRRP